MTIEFNKYKKFGAYHWKWYEQKPRYKAHVDRVRDWIKERPCLDIGAGDGLMCKIVGMVGVDNSIDAINVAKRRGVDIVLGDAYKLPFKDEEFDACYIGDTLEHLEFPLKALIEARRVIKNYAYVSGPIRGGVLEAYEYDDSKWSADEVQRRVEEAGFKLEREVELLELARSRVTFYAKFKKV